MKKKKQNKKKKFSILKNIVSLYWFLFCVIFPFIISMLPVIPYVITNESNWMWWLLISYPFGTAIAIKLWTPENFETGL